MEYEPGGVQDLQEAVERLVPRARPGGGDYAHNTRNHDDNAHAHLRASLLGPSLSIPARAREPRAGHLAAGRADRFRRPAARARRSTSRSRPEARSHVGTCYIAPPLRKWRPLQGLRYDLRGALYSAARSGSLRAARQARRGGIPSTQGATVFENSTACAPDGRLRPIRLCASRFDPAAGLRARRRPEKSRSTAVPRRRARARSMCTSSPSCGALTALREQFFTESLILAQDERWRRA